MQRRNCSRFSIPGTTLTYKEKKIFVFREKYIQDRFPVINISKGGAKFLCHQRIEPGRKIFVRLAVPNFENSWEFSAVVRWIAMNPEQSYRYQTGIAFNSYGRGKNKNPKESLSFLKQLETWQKKGMHIAS